MASIIEIIIFVAGVAFIILEIFVIPGFGVFGIIGIIMMVAGLFMGLISDLPYFNWDILSTAITQLAAAMLLSILMFYILSKLLPKSTRWNRLILQEDIHETSGYTSTPQHSKEYLVGKEGTAYTDLRPSGTVEIDDERIDVVTQGEYILSGSKVIVSKTEGSKVIVKEIRT
jgi:membrane-bound serine protease (ClpP class)